ncbi:hypothetical protein MOC55_13925 [Bacillus spizizenii]|uniref:Uncharacterized protein n=1 Tax=Bacillus spizizenii TaxID=96241 RepID=A0A9Q4DKU4_BACSC|nr:hypothetical protein [Bacillus spizizenii]MCY8155563.1 hypothetical protein [Bacillus spizizenii]MCY8312961.1 hypothetical protein [Bacillus spizizenii]MCY8416624.1 hypothetical protein [Bacillus spizizenii]MCY9333698.1 hypothetical protein [Bacillus spizizenii]
MPFVEETLRHDSFLDDLFDKVFRRFKDKSGNYWWQDFNKNAAKVDLYKISFEKGLFVKTSKGYTSPELPTEGMLCITRHLIFRRWDNQLLAFAQSTGAVKISTKDLPTNKKDLLKWFVNFYKDFVDYTTVYAYTLDKYEGYTHFISGGKATPVTVLGDDSGVGVHKASLDIEYHNKNDYHPDMKQSPIITMKLKGDTGEHVASIGKLNYKTNTNWWADSLIQLRGVFDETSAFFTLKVDSAPMWEDNGVTLVPFFFGNLVTKNTTKSNETPIAMLGGTQVGKFFDFDNVEEKTDTLQPITRNYVHHPSNGIDSVMVKKTKYGSRYQEHFLRWNAPPNQMPPTREELRKVKKSLGTDQEEEFARKYPRAWNYLRYGYYNYGFHPSRYSEKIHSSRATVMHPEDGVIGYIPNIVLIPLINLMEGDRLKFPHWCGDCDELPYNPQPPTESTQSPWSPQPNDEEPTGDQGDQPEEYRFNYLCDGSVPVNTISDVYWKPSPATQEYMLNNENGIGRELSVTFWEGRNDWIDFFYDDSSKYKLTNSKINVEDYHKLLWKTISDAQAGKVNLDKTWTEFRDWSADNLSCLSDLQKASIYMSVKLQKPVNFFPGAEGFLSGDTLDKMVPLISKVPSEVYDWMDFNNVYEDNGNDSGVVGAWVLDNVITVSYTDGTKENILSTFRSLVNFEPQLLNYPLSAAKAHRPHDYIKSANGFGNPVVGGEYLTYYKEEMTDDNFVPFVAAEVAIHEMGHAVSNYGFDKLGVKLHEMDEWLNISGWVRKSDGTFAELTKSSSGTVLDNGKLAPVSDYGCFGPAEDFAEAFMMYAINRPFLRDKFPAKHDFIMNQLKAMGIDPNL